MRIKIYKNQVDNYTVFLRRLGYALIQDRRQGTESFVRRLGEGHYPRIHLYVDDLGDFLSFNLHLDQKKVSYSGFNRHNAEYDNEIIEGEIARIKSLIDSSKAEKTKGSTEGTRDLMSQINSGNIEQDAKDFLENKKRKKKFWFF
jgi:hypothetical protein